MGGRGPKPGCQPWAAARGSYQPPLDPTGHHRGIRPNVDLDALNETIEPSAPRLRAGSGDGVIPKPAGWSDAATVFRLWS